MIRFEPCSQLIFVGEQLICLVYMKILKKITINSVKYHLMELKLQKKVNFQHIHKERYIKWIRKYLIQLKTYKVVLYKLNNKTNHLHQKWLKE